MIKRTELLVHAGAPSGRKDDDKYVALAEACVNFEGKVVEDSRTSVRVSKRGEPGSEALTQLPLTEPAVPARENAKLFLEDTQMAYAALESQFMTSSLVLSAYDNVHSLDEPSSSQQSIRELPLSTPTKGRDVQDETSCLVRDVLESAAKPKSGALQSQKRRLSTSDSSHLTRSSYLRTPILDGPSKRAKPSDAAPKVRSAAGYIALPEANNVGAACIGPPTPACVVAAFPAVQGVLSQQSGDVQQSTSELPTTYSLSNITSRSSKAKSGPSQRSTSDPGPSKDVAGSAAQLSNPPYLDRPGSADRIETRHSKEKDRSTIAATNGSAGAQPSAARKPTTINSPGAVPDAQRKEVDQGKALTLSQQQLAALSMSIRPPMAQVALDDCITHVTTGLRLLVDHPDLANCFKPVKQTRELRPFERGCWQFRCPNNDAKWNAAKQASFWIWLQKYVGDGTAGWGIWCIREVDLDHAGCLGLVKVYCWGEVTKHVYHMLYVASSAQVRRMGLQWVDGNGDVVVEMKGK